MKTLLCIAVIMAAALPALAESGTATILDGVATNVSGPFVLGLTGPSNFLIVTNQGVLNDTDGIIGLTPASQENWAVVTGFRSVWANSAGLYLGRTGALNRLQIVDGGTLQALSLVVGERSSGNQLSAEEAASIFSDTLTIGAGPAAMANQVSLRGPLVSWTNFSRVVVGSDGSSNLLSITEGARLRGGSSFTIGNNTASRGNEVLISGPGSRLFGVLGITVGASGSGQRLVVENGAAIQSLSAGIGQNCVSRDNVVLLTGVGTVWSNGLFEVGFCSTNHQLVISNGARLYAELVRSSVQGGTSNGITVAGFNSLLRAASDLVIGNSGPGHDRLTLLDGARLEGRNDRLGSSAWSNVATLSGEGTTWTNLTLMIGEASSRNRLSLGEHALVISRSATLGVGGKSEQNEAALEGPGAAWRLAGTLAVGSQGHTNRVSVRNGSILQAQNLYLGSGTLLLSSGPTYYSRGNSARVEGPTSQIQVSSNVFVGASGSGNRLEIHHGARVENDAGVVGLGLNSQSNVAVVSGPGSTWYNTNDLIIGSNGILNELNIQAGGRVSAQNGFVGWQGQDLGGGTACGGLYESLSRVQVIGPGSIWENRGDLFVGYSAGGNRLSVSNGAAVTAQNLIVGRVRWSNGNPLCLHNPSSVTIDGSCLAVTNAAGTGVLEVRHGVLQLNSGEVLTDQLLATNQPSRALVVAGGTLRLRGGTWRETANTPFKVGDDSRVAALRLDGGLLSVQPALQVSSHSMICGHGTLQSQILTVFGTIAPGAEGAKGVGRLVQSGGIFALETTSTLAVDIAGRVAGQDYDQLVVGAAVLGGRLNVRLSDGFVPSPNDSFEILSAPSIEEGFPSVDGRVRTVDQLGSFRMVHGNTNVVLTDFQSTDVDQDGIADDWARQHFGHSPLSALELAADADNDGADNRAEFKAGTDPLDPSSVFRIDYIYAPPVSLDFQSVPGKHYRVWFSDDLEHWREVVQPHFQVLSAPYYTWVDDGKDTGDQPARSRFYRISVE